MKKLLENVQNAFKKAKQTLMKAFALSKAKLWHRIYWALFRVLSWKSKYYVTIVIVMLVILIVISACLSPILQDVLEPYFSDEKKLNHLRFLLRGLGTALMGAAAIAFSLIMFAMQFNAERMPHGLFQRFSKDKYLMGTFLGTFFLAISIAAASLIIHDNSWVAITALGAIWGTVSIFALFLYAYRRALDLISPTKQLSLLVEDTTHEMRVWVRRAERARPLYGEANAEEYGQHTSSRTTHDIPLTLYFRDNPHWTFNAIKAIKYAITFSRVYAEKGDHEVSGMALSAVIQLNKEYIKAKGKTFFTDNPFLDDLSTTDGFIINTLEHLRQNVRIGVTRGDEQLIEDNFRAIALLLEVYIEIDYSTSYGSKKHADIAAEYLSSAVESVTPHDMEDVIMEGIRVMGQSATLLLEKDDPNDFVILLEKIVAMTCLGITKESYRPITLIGVEQIAKLTFALFRNSTSDISSAARELKMGIAIVAELFLAVPNTHRENAHSAYLSPYYSGTSSQALQEWLRQLANKLIQADTDNETAQKIIRNIEDWADGLDQTEKKVLLLAIENRSPFTFDIINWIANVSKILLALSNAPACSEHTKTELRENARRLVYPLLSIPLDNETVTFVENYDMTEILFGIALEGHRKDCLEFSESVQGLLLRWAFEGGRHPTGWGILEESLYGLATLTLITGSKFDVENLKTDIAKRLKEPNAPDQPLRDRVASEIRQKATTLQDEAYQLDTIAIAMSKTDHDQMSQLLEELADLLSPIP